ncbi:MAG TPA: YdjY domain-containing protein [Pirellulales bacterium]|nr:YdjY domain-containing protein [Pirellulales bacterium]
MRIRRRSSWILGLLLVAACARADEPATPVAVPDKGDPPATNAPAADGLVRLDSTAPVWIDVKRKRVVMVAEVCLREGPLEMFACPRGTKEHESILSVPVRPFTVHAGLLAVGAEPGNPAHWIPKFEPARGTPIEIILFWTDEQGNRQRALAQDWIRQAKTLGDLLGDLYPWTPHWIRRVNIGKAMEQSWVFGGSSLHEDEQTGAKTYLADYGEFICVSNFPGAMLDVPVESSDNASELQFEAYSARIPPRGTKVTLVLTPKPAEIAKGKPVEVAAEEDAQGAAPKDQ